MSDIPTLQWLVNWANIGIVAALVASLVAGAAAIVLSKRLGAAKDEQYAKEKQASDERVAALTLEAENAKKERAQADLRIEEARARASKADEVAGEANERAGALEVKAQELAQQNLEMRSGVAALEKEAVDAKRSYLELQERIKGRHLSDENRLRAVSLLREHPDKGPVIVRCFEAVPDSCGFAEEIIDVLEKAGWSGKRQKVGLSSSLPPVGAGIVVRSRETAPRSVSILQRAFGLQAGESKTIPEGVVAIIVGSKP